ncbi:FAD dependent oxidoreductase [Glonium stellatum]|uniref:FAD dependent oxidoreductase n=1 Tax=Glonium stellatum TaxID=574774 RepID=A0A8E2JRP5_9PEZI|nr:FAD dependent oxidoreductase [Glonium stellatum]
MAPSQDILSKSSRILIVGAGTVGLSAAFHLTERGYTNVKVIDRDTVPSAYSAGNDLNKIVRADYQDPFYAKLALKAISAWETPFWSSFFRRTGYLVSASGSAPEKASVLSSKILSCINNQPDFPTDSIHLTPESQSIRIHVPQLTGEIKGWSGYFNKHAGYAHASAALKMVYEELARRCVEFIFGEDGEATEIEAISTKSSFVRGTPNIRTRSGAIHTADIVILALGAYTAQLLPAAGGQLTAKAWSVAHIQLTPEEANQLAGMPVVNCQDLGFFFEPDPDTGLLKLAAHGGGYTNLGTSVFYKYEVSLPPPEASQNRGIPVHDESSIRQLLAETLPQFQHRPLVDQFICWCADTEDSEYVIDFVPEWDNLLLAGGDSGHAFKMFPVFGEWVVDTLEQGCQDLERWRWKNPERRGSEISWRIGDIRDIKDVKRSDKVDDFNRAAGSLKEASWV